jgi:hypothetical protein
MAIKRSEKNFKYVSKHLKNDFDVAMEVVKHNGANLQYVSTRLQNNFKIVMMAVQHNRSNYFSVLKYASAKMRKNKKIALEAIKHCKEEWKYVDKQAIMEILKQNGTLYYYINYKLKMDIDIILTAIRQNIKALKYVPQDAIKRNQQQILKVVQTWTEKANESFANHDRTHLAKKIVNINGLYIQY